ncbi:hypothetical protein AT269_10105 [Bacillus cereus]|nr:hypothetical protein AT269_10105 [Bacillus cereus]
MFEKILKEMIDYTSIRHKYFSISNDTGNTIFLFIVLGTLIIVSLIIEEMVKRIFRQYVEMKRIMLGLIKCLRK